MSENYKEQHPLLCEEISEDEHYNSPRYYRRRPSIYKGRARPNLKGAASIITRWPDHWSSFLAYWWIGLGMISLMTFIIYNSLFAFAALPTANLKPTRLLITNPNEKLSFNTLPEVFMHVFVRQYEEIDFNKYMPYIKEISNKYDKMKYHLIVVANDTNLGYLSAEENNEIAMNSLWKPNLKKEPENSNIVIEYVTLSGYMENSPLRKHWKTLPQHLIEFLARSVSIWDKGGIAFDPIILTPKSQNTIYKEKLHKILNKYADINEAVSESIIINKPNKTAKKERKLNNIRDIINALENEDDPINAFSQQTLAEAENIKLPIVTRNERHLSTVPETMVKRKSENNTEKFSHVQILPDSYSNDGYAKETNPRFEVNNSTKSAIAFDTSQNSTKLSLLPLFLEFIFHNKLQAKQSPTEAVTSNRTSRSVIKVSKSENNKSFLSLDAIDKKLANTYKPVIISAAGIYNKSEYDKVYPSKDTGEIMEKNLLTIDLRGNIIATDTACHAFLGTIFSNAVHHSEEESVTDFIIAELTIFCKGLLSSCMGIDLILL